MYTSAQQLFRELQKQGTKAALFEGNWGAQHVSYVFEVGAQLEHLVPNDTNICGFMTYEGEQIFFPINKVHKFDEELPAAVAQPAQAEMPAAVFPVPVEMFNKYSQKIAQIKELILSGETYQVNYSVPFSVPNFTGDPFEIYCALSQINPSPYQCFIETSDGVLISNSPECLMKIDSTGHIETIPIKGTLPRGKTIAEDATNEQMLLASGKNKAELAMIVDLERNDLGKVCTPGTVRVSSHRKIEKYSHVMHTVSVVEGRLEAGKNWRDALEALFPGGSVTGCPKKRTMEIIQNLEQEPRGIYCGSAGFVLPEEGAVFNILIRSLWFDRKMNELSFRSGGGIVADSDAKEEYDELMHKAAALLKVTEQQCNTDI